VSLKKKDLNQLESERKRFAKEREETEKRYAELDKMVIASRLLQVFVTLVLMEHVCVYRSRTSISRPSRTLRRRSESSLSSSIKSTGTY
jgi:hypothetical protein